MRILHLQGDQFSELTELPDALPSAGFLWVAAARGEFEAHVVSIQAALQSWTGGQLVDEHVADLINQQLPSYFDYTSWYDLLVFRRLARGAAGQPAGAEVPTPSQVAKQTLLDVIDTSALGFALFDRVLVTVHPTDCAVREFFVSRFQGLVRAADHRSLMRLPFSTADLMLRMVNHMVDGYLDLRRLLTRQLGLLQQELLDPRNRFDDWHLLLQARSQLHQLEDICEDQRSAMQEWLDALDEWPAETEAQARRERELLRVRTRDVLEHIERVLGHVRRLEQTAESAVQMHFSAQANRTNDIMRTLTVLTAIFLPLNLITGYFGMNFDSLPFIHLASGAAWATLILVLVAAGLLIFFRRKRYLGRSLRRSGGR